MAKILVSYHSFQEVSIQTMRHYFEGFIDVLKQLGNDIFVFNTAYYTTQTSNVITDDTLNTLILQSAKRFDPELIITFGHQLPQCILDHFDVPIVIWDGDHPAYFSGIDYMKDHLERYTIFSITKDWYQDYLDLGFRKNAYHYMPNATAVEAQAIDQTMNISFLGIRCYAFRKLPLQMKKYHYLEQSKEIVMESLLTNNFCSQYYLDKYFQKEKDAEVFEERHLYPLLEYRWLLLANMLDLGLTISGHISRWEDITEFMPQLFSAYNPRRVWTLGENSEFYNRSKISLCPMHPQGNGKAFSWRAFDVMASNACLVPSESSELRNLTKDYVELPMYTSPYDARELCKQLLNDDERRNQIVLASQKFVNENARWDKRFMEAQSILGISLNNPGKEGSVYNMTFDDPEIYRCRFIAACSSSSTVKTLEAQSTSKTQKATKRLRHSIHKLWMLLGPFPRIVKALNIGLMSFVIGSLLLLMQKDALPLLFFKRTEQTQSALEGFGNFFSHCGAIFCLYGCLMMLVKVSLKMRRLIRRLRERNMD